jgi:hypothetical protein
MTIPDAQGAEILEGNSGLPAREVGELLGVGDVLEDAAHPVVGLDPRHLEIVVGSP